MRKALLPLLLALLALPAAGETTRFWRENSADDFQKGTPHGVALRSDGELLLAPRYREVADLDVEYLWTLADDGQGNLYAGGGSPARVVRIDSSGHTRVVFESKELEVHALVTDPKTGTLYVATSPDGKVYEIPRGGEAKLLYDPGTKYIWDLARAADGTLYVATGDKGEIYRIAPDGKGARFFTSKETHIRALALDAAGNLYAGTEPGGLVLRLTPAGAAFVLYEMPGREVTALRFDAAGNLYVAAIGQKTPVPGFPVVPPTPVLPTQPTPQTQPTASITTTMVVTPGIAPTTRIPFPTLGGSDVYRIAPDGHPEALWSSPSELVYSLAFDAAGRLLAGTGNEGEVVALDSPTRFTYLAKASSQQVTALLTTAGGRVYAGTANPGMLFSLGPELETEGTFESDVYDAELFSRWGHITWRSRSPLTSDGVALRTRSGNTSDAEENWSPWSGPYADPQESAISSPPARFIQWKAVLHAGPAGTPSLSEVSVAYLRRNVAPVVESVIVQEPGIGIRSLPQPSQQNQPVALELPPPSTHQKPGTLVVAQPGQTPQRIETPPQGVSQPGVRSVVWSAYDDNDDDLSYSVYYRGENETRWKLLQDKITDKYTTWDATTLADGAYFIKVVASDAPSNPPDLALTGENVSDRFEVDNTPPAVEPLTATPSGHDVEIRFTARDAFSPLQEADYSVDAQDWEMVFPESGTTDSRQHHYVFHLKDLSAGEHTVVVRVTDRFDNPSLAKVTFTLP